MRLKKTLNRRVGDTPYYKWLIADLPPEIVDALGWEAGEALEAVADGKSLIVRKAKPKSIKRSREH